MALNFPDSPTLNQVYTDSTSGFSYQWDGVVWKSYSPSSASQIKILDDFSASFNGVTQSFALTSNGNVITPPSPQSLIINLGGVVQDPTDDYSVSGSNIIFSTPPTGGLTFSGVSLGPAVPLNTILDGTVTDGSLRISTTAVVGSATTFTEDLVVQGDARVTGILTVGSGVTIDGSTSIVTASAFFGDGSGLSGVSAGSTVADDTTTNQEFYPLFTTQTTGIVTATKVSTSKLSFNPSSGTLSATVFSGTLSGNATTATNATNVAITDNTSTNSTYYVHFGSATSGNDGVEVDSSTFTYNPSTNVLTAGTFSGSGASLTSLDASNISSGTLAIARGGTNGSATPTAGGVSYGTGSAYAFTSAGTSGQVLTSNGTSAPTWQNSTSVSKGYIAGLTSFLN